MLIFKGVKGTQWLFISSREFEVAIICHGFRATMIRYSVIWLIFLILLGND